MSALLSLNAVNERECFRGVTNSIFDRCSIVAVE